MSLFDDVRHDRTAFLRRQAATSAELTHAWRGARQTILERLGQLTQQMQQARDAGTPISPSWLYEQHRLQTLLAQVEHQVTAYGSYARMTVTQAQQQALQSGLQASRGLLDASKPRGVPWTFNRLPASAVNALVGRTSAGTPLSDLFDGFGAEASDKVKRTLTSGMALGWSPARIARGVADDLDVSRQRAVVIAHNEMMNAYRDASLATYRANSDVVEQWVWVADLGSACAICTAMNGTLMDLEEDLDSHVGCRCSAAPVTRSWDSILGDAGIDTSDLDIPETSLAWPWQDVPDGSTWFAEQDAATQRAILGPGKLAAYQDGALTLDDLVGVQHDPEWGTSRYEKSLKDLGLSEYAQ